MSDEKLESGIYFNNMRINSADSNSGVFAGHNLQLQWYSDTRFLAGFGVIDGDENHLVDPFCVVTDSGSSEELLKYFEEQLKARIGKKDM